MLKNILIFFQQKLPFTESLFYFCDVERILHHIEKLLACNDHAVVPGLGGFVVQKQSATISGGKILPPSANVSFNPLINHTDGMLAVTISRELHISYREAAKLIENETGQFLRQLKKSKKLEFGRIGTFHMDKDAHLLFTPAVNADFLPANFGLNPIFLPVRSTTKTKDIVFTLSAKNLMKYAAVFITLISLLISSEINNDPQVIKADFYSLNKVDLPEITVTPPASPEVNTDIITTTTTPSKQYIYKVVVAVFESENTALKFCDHLVSQNFTETEVLNTSNNSKVSIRTFTDLIAAVNYMEQIRHQDKRFKDAWVMKTKASLFN